MSGNMLDVLNFLSRMNWFSFVTNKRTGKRLFGPNNHTTSPSLEHWAGSSNFGIFFMLLLFASGIANLKSWKRHRIFKHWLLELSSMPTRIFKFETHKVTESNRTSNVNYSQRHRWLIILITKLIMLNIILGSFIFEIMEDCV